MKSILLEILSEDQIYFVVSYADGRNERGIEKPENILEFLTRLLSGNIDTPKPLTVTTGRIEDYV